MAGHLGETLIQYRDALNSPAVRQLNRDWALITFTVLTETFDGFSGSLHSDELHQRVALCFDALGDYPALDGNGVKLPASAAEIRDRVNDWVKSELLYRYDEEDGRHYRLTAHATTAQQYLNGIYEAQRNDRSYASGQGAQHLLHLGRELALAIAPDPESKHEQLTERRSRLLVELELLEGQIEQIEKGEGIDPDPLHVVLDKYQHFSDAVSTMLTNMKMVEQQINRLGTRIREAFSAETRPHGQILNEYLDWLNDAHESAAGLGFAAAYEVLAETDLFDTLLRASMSHELMTHLTSAQVRQFRAIPKQLRAAMSDVMAVQGRMDQRVSNFLQTYDPLTDRQISHLLARCHRMLADLSHVVHPGDELDLPHDSPLYEEGNWPCDRFSIPLLSLELDMTPPSLPVTVKVASTPQNKPDPQTLERIFTLGAPHDDAIRRGINNLLQDASMPVSGTNVFESLDHLDSRITDLAGLIRISAETDGVALDSETQVIYVTHQYEGASVEYTAPTITFTAHHHEGDDIND